MTIDPQNTNPGHVAPRSAASRGSEDNYALRDVRGSINKEAAALRAFDKIGPVRDEINWGADDD